MSLPGSIPHAALPNHDPRRLDQALTRPATFYRYLLSDLGYGEPASSDSEQSYDPWAEECVRQQIHRISREQMRQRVGDKAYDLTFAPADIFPRQRSVIGTHANLLVCRRLDGAVITDP